MSIRPKYLKEGPLPNFLVYANLNPPAQRSALAHPHLHPYLAANRRLAMCDDVWADLWAARKTARVAADLVSRTLSPQQVATVLATEKRSTPLLALLEHNDVDDVEVCKVLNSKAGPAVARGLTNVDHLDDETYRLVATKAGGKRLLQWVLDHPGLSDAEVTDLVASPQPWLGKVSAELDLLVARLLHTRPEQLEPLTRDHVAPALAQAAACSHLLADENLQMRLAQRDPLTTTFTTPAELDQLCHMWQLLIRNPTVPRTVIEAVYVNVHALATATKRPFPSYRWELVASACLDRLSSMSLNDPVPPLGGVAYYEVTDQWHTEGYVRRISPPILSDLRRWHPAQLSTAVDLVRNQAMSNRTAETLSRTLCSPEAVAVLGEEEAAGLRAEVQRRYPNSFAVFPKPPPREQPQDTYTTVRWFDPTKPTRLWAIHRFDDRTADYAGSLLDTEAEWHAFYALLVDADEWEGESLWDLFGTARALCAAA